MGLDAAVRCRCWEDGLCNPPASLTPRLWYDPATAEVNQITPENLSEQKILELYLEYDLWVMEGACAQRSMSIAREHVSNWGGLREFQHALHSVGEGLCATLLREIPNSNGGLTKPAAARTCLAELDHFCSLSQFGTIVELVDGDSGGVIHSLVEPYHGWLATNGATNVSFRLNVDGTFQIERGRAGVMCHDPDAQILFRSRAFSQAETSAGEFCFTDLLSGDQLLCSNGLNDAPGGNPASFKVRQRTDTPARYAYCIEPLRRVFQAAVDNNHPVLWS